MAMMRMRIFGNDNPRTPEEMELKRKWFAKRKAFGKDLESASCKEMLVWEFKQTEFELLTLIIQKPS